MKRLVLFVVLAASLPLAAEGVPGRVIDVEGSRFWVEVQGDQAPNAGEPVVVMIEVPGLDAPVLVFEGKVTGMEDGYVVVERSGGDAAPHVGDTARVGR